MFEQLSARNSTVRIEGKYLLSSHGYRLGRRQWIWRNTASQTNNDEVIALLFDPDLDMPPFQDYIDLVKNIPGLEIISVGSEPILQKTTRFIVLKPKKVKTPQPSIDQLLQNAEDNWANLLQPQEPDKEDGEGTIHPTHPPLNSRWKYIVGGIVLFTLVLFVFSILSSPPPPGVLTPELPVNQFGFTRPSITDSDLDDELAPVLAYLNSAPPIYADNFDRLPDGWSTFDIPMEALSVVDGQLSFNVVSSEVAQGRKCAGMTTNSIPTARDFAMQMDGQVYQGTFGWVIVFPHSFNTKANLYFNIGKDGDGTTWFGFRDDSKAVPRVTTPSPSVHSNLKNPIRFLVIVKGDHRALFVNGKLWSWFTTKSALGDGFYQPLRISTCGPDAEIHLDNIRWWDIENLP